MPYSSAWVDPEIYLTHNDVTVYHLYDDDDIEAGCLAYWYTTNMLGGLDGKGIFDVQTLAGYTPDADHAEIIRAAIDRGELTNKED